ncbi:CLUMA_CG003712, isoform A [Clunio marinus]|uniref:CLUMA_CG003712, isoform A n=1 Tax=Clunio marinus TaxID=568069 RepID=A0A1J1HV06_9DIPT|nr:CLUMA_CG003712, isoform A [Clunio marinus]
MEKCQTIAENIPHKLCEACGFEHLYLAIKNKNKNNLYVTCERHKLSFAFAFLISRIKKHKFVLDGHVKTDTFAL